MIKAPRFVPLPPWFGGDLQTLRNHLRPPRDDILAQWPGETLHFAMKDGTGDELIGTLHRPAEERGRPLVLLLHGLTQKVVTQVWLGDSHSPTLRAL